MNFSSLVIIGAASLVAGILGFIGGLFFRSAQTRKAQVERDDLRTFFERSGVDFSGMREMSAELANKAASITETAAKMSEIIHLANVDSDTVSSFGFGSCKSCSCRGYRRRSPDICECGHHFSQHWG